jgi:hypothetical protein
MTEEGEGPERQPDDAARRRIELMHIEARAWSDWIGSIEAQAAAEPARSAIHDAFAAGFEAGCEHTGGTRYGADLLQRATAQPVRSLIQTAFAAGYDAGWRASANRKS